MPPKKPKHKESAGPTSQATEQKARTAEQHTREDHEGVEWRDDELQELEFGGTASQIYAALVLGIYLSTMHPTVAGGDSGELMGCACELGVAHPPGYPLFTMLSWLGIQLIPFGSPGYRMNVVSVLFATCASWLLFHAVLRWHLGLMRSQPSAVWRGSTWVALLASGLFSFCPLVWKYSTHAEVFALNNMFLSLLQYLCVRFVQERDVKWARLGALSIGLGLSNQHTLLLHALPLVAWMLWIGRTKLFVARELAILPLLGLLGMTPYLYLFWAAKHAPLGSWGDTSTLSGWPVVGFWTHFFRKEYGTFALYSGKNAQTASLWHALGKYTHNMMTNTLTLAWLAPIGVAASLSRGGISNAGTVFVSCFLVYTVTFHSLANLPLDNPHYVGVQMRFWMQSHLTVFTFLPLGLQTLLSLLSLWRPAPARPLLSLLVALQAALHYHHMDQSRNWHSLEFGKRLLDSKSHRAILLTQGDLVTNSVRYLQRCEHHRRDIAQLDMPAMTFEWFKATQGPHLPGIKFPGVQYTVSGRQTKDQRSCCSYSMRQFLDANIDSGRDIFVVGGWYGSENPEGQPDGIPDFNDEPVGFGRRITRKHRPLSDAEFTAYRDNFTLPEIPDPNKYDNTTWEATLMVEYVTFAEVARLERAIAKGTEEAEGSRWMREQAELDGTIAELEAIMRIAEHASVATDDMYRNLGIAYGRQKCPEPKRYPEVDCPGQRKLREMMKKFLAVTDKPRELVATAQLIVDKPNSFVNF